MAIRRITSLEMFLTRLKDKMGFCYLLGGVDALNKEFPECNITIEMEYPTDYNALNFCKSFCEIEKQLLEKYPKMQVTSAGIIADCRTYLRRQQQLQLKFNKIYKEKKWKQRK